MPSSFKERAPKAFFDEKRDAWMFGSAEVPVQAVGGLFMAGQRPDQVESFRRAGFSVARPGGWDPLERMKDMVTDGVAAEVLYPSLGLGLFCLEDAALQEALFRTYNDWVIEYCQKVPDRLFGIALISMFDVDHAIAEMERCKEQGIVGTMIWQVPHPELPFTVRALRTFLGGVPGSPIAGSSAHSDRLRRQHAPPDQPRHQALSYRRATDSRNRRRSVRHHFFRGFGALSQA